MSRLTSQERALMFAARTGNNKLIQSLVANYNVDSNCCDVNFVGHRYFNIYSEIDVF